MDNLEQTPGWRAANRALWLLGTAIVAAHGVSMLIYGPGLRAAAEEAAQQQMTVEHAAICDRLQTTGAGTAREQCLNLLLQLQQRHEQAYAARTAGAF